MATPDRPFRLRAILDLELTETEWTALSQAYLPDVGPERTLRLVVMDATDVVAPRELDGTILADIPARPADLRVDPPGGRTIQLDPPEEVDRGPLD